MGSADANGAAFARPGDSGAVAAGDRVVGDGSPIHGYGSVVIDRAAAVQYAGDGGIWIGSAIARRDRNLRVDGVYGGTADAGDRNQAGVRRGGEPGQKHGCEAGHESGAGWRRRRAWGGLGSGTLDRKLAIRR